MNLQLSYHPCCQGYLNPLSPTFVLKSHLANRSQLHIEGIRISLFQPRFNSCKVEVFKVVQLVSYCFLLILNDGIDVEHGLK